MAPATLVVFLLKLDNMRMFAGFFLGLPHGLKVWPGCMEGLSLCYGLKIKNCWTGPWP